MKKLQKKLLLLSLILMLAMPNFALAGKIRDSGDALPAQTEKSQQDIQKPGDENKEMTEEEKKAVLDSINKSLTELSKANELDSTIKLNIIGKNPNKRTVSMNVRVESKYKYPEGNKKDIKKLQASLKMKINLLNSDMVANIYVRNGYIYMNTLGEKVKKKITKKEARQYLIKDPVQKIEPDWIKNISKEENTISLDVDPKAFFSYLMKSQEYRSMLGGLSDIKTMKKTLKKISVKYVFEDDAIKQGGFKMFFKEKVKKNKYNKSIVNFTVNYNKVNDIGEIVYPKNLNSYKKGR